MAPVSQEHMQRVLEHQTEQRMRRALQVTAAFLKLVESARLLPTDVRTKIKDFDGEVIAECSLAEALDMANEALEP